MHSETFPCEYTVTDVRKRISPPKADNIIFLFYDTNTNHKTYVVMEGETDRAGEQCRTPEWQEC